MILQKIYAEVRELDGIINDEPMILSEISEHLSAETIESMVRSMNLAIRKLARMEVILENANFKTKVAIKMAVKCLRCISDIYEQYEKLAGVLRKETREREESLIGLFRSYKEWDQICLKVALANEIVSELIEGTWEPLPDDETEDNVENIVISSETRSMSLSDIASDIGNLNNFFESICRMISPDQNKSNNVYLRRVETGSLVVAVSCAMQAAPIIAFIFWCVKLYQKAEKRYLDNADNKLKVINESLNIAKEILKIDPDNKEADEIIQKCGVSVLNFLENNPTGTINGEHYDIGMEKPRIEDKENR